MKFAFLASFVILYPSSLFAITHKDCVVHLAMGDLPAWPIQIVEGLTKNKFSYNYFRDLSELKDKALYAEIRITQKNQTLCTATMAIKQVFKKLSKKQEVIIHHVVERQNKVDNKPLELTNCIPALTKIVESFPTCEIKKKK